jgi:hypothetical protein
MLLSAVYLVQALGMLLAVRQAVFWGELVALLLGTSILPAFGRKHKHGVLPVMQCPQTVT